MTHDQHDSGEWLAETPAGMLAGLRAKARASCAYNTDGPHHDMIGRLTALPVIEPAGRVAA